MADILRTLDQLSDHGLSNFHVNLVEASSNLRKKQQETLLDLIQKRFRIYLSYDVKEGEVTEEQLPFGQAPGEVDRFFNKEHNFSITWYTSMQDYHAKLSAEKMELMRSLKGESKRQQEMRQAREMMRSPVFIFAHELFDALPIHQFHMNKNYQWCEKVVALDENTGQLEIQISDTPTDNTIVKLKPEEFFSDAAKADMKPGDSYELCPEATNVMQDITNILELSSGMALVIDYGEDHAFSNSFRGLKKHELVKDDQQILDNAGNIDLTAYVNFTHLKEIAKRNKEMTVEGPMPQGLFLEYMGIAPRVEALQNKARSQNVKKLLWDCYERLCSPDHMGGTYKVLFVGDKKAGEVYPFLSEETLAKEQQTF